jgi:predicted DNA-binding transcriptional regulator YafY
VWRGCRVRLRYREGRRVVQRTVDPLGLVLKGGAWYLIARRVAGMRVYRVSRVAAVRPLDETFERPAGRVVVAFDNLADAHRELLRFGADLEVLEPAELRDLVGRTSRDVAALYAR